MHLLKCRKQLEVRMSDNVKNDVKSNGFEWDGIWITDPTMDETGRFPVDPKEYYGVDV